jgi:RimJ/RimL family protein N-acetyltransferase
VALGPLRQELVPLFQKWNNDFVVNYAARSLRPVTLEEETEAHAHFSKEKSFVFFTIYEKTTLRPIGFTYLSDIANQTAEFGIVIGEKELHHKGFGTETTQLMLDYAFTILGLHNVMLKVLAYNNMGGIKAYKKAGFREIGRRREAKLIIGQRWDMVYMDCLSTEFQSPFLHALILGQDKGKSA